MVGLDDSADFTSHAWGTPDAVLLALASRLRMDLTAPAAEDQNQNQNQDQAIGRIVKP